MCVWCSISGGSCGFADDWAGWLPEPPSLIPFTIHTPLSSLFHLHRPKRRKCPTSIAPIHHFTLKNVGIYIIFHLKPQFYFQHIDVLIFWFPGFKYRCASFCPVNVNFVCSSNVDGLVTAVCFCFDVRFQVLFVALLMTEQVNFLSPPPISPSSSRLLPLHPSNPIAPEGVSI